MSALSISSTLSTCRHVEAERRLIACLFKVKPENLSTIRRSLSADDFANVKHAYLFEAALDAVDECGLVDVGMVADFLAKSGRLEAVGGYEAVGEYVATGESGGAWPTLVHQVRQAADRRKILSGIDRLASETKAGRPLEEVCQEGSRLFATTVHDTRPTVEEYRPFPIEALPHVIRDYVSQASEAIGCDPAFIALPCLSVTAALIGNTRVVQSRQDWFEPSTIWTLIVGDSGTLKSPAFEKALSPVQAIQQARYSSYRDDLERFEAQDRESKGKRSTPQSSESLRPRLERLLASDTTIEAMCSILSENPRGVLLCRDELSAWFGSLTRYKGKNGGSDLPHWLELHRGGQLIVDRKSNKDGPIFVQRATVSIAGGIQPGVLAKALTQDTFESGLVARFLFASPPRTTKQWTEASIDPKHLGAYRDLCNHLLSLKYADQTNHEPHTIELATDAKKLWVEFYEEWATRQAQSSGSLAAAYSKLEGYTLRLALVHHCVESAAWGDSDLYPLKKKSIQAGITLVRWFAAETERLYAALSSSAEQIERDKLIDLIRRKGGSISARDLVRSSRAYHNVDRAKAALDELAFDGLAYWSSKAINGAGRPSKELVLASTRRQC